MIKAKFRRGAKSETPGLQMAQKAGSAMTVKGRIRRRAVGFAARWPMPFCATPDKTTFEARRIEQAKAERVEPPARPARKAALAQHETAQPRMRKRPVKSRDDDREGASTDCVKAYFNGIKMFKLLTSEEEKTLAMKIAKGDMEARKRMIETNLRLVVNIAKRYQNRGLPLQDLIEEGNIGLIKSVERFKATKECKFSTYATYWIKQAVERAIANQSGIVRLPIHVTADMSKLTRVTRELTLSLKRDPSVSEISKRTGLSGRYVKKLGAISRKSYSLEAGFPDETDQPLMDRLEDERVVSPMDAIDTSRRSERISEWLGQLDGNESTILRLRFGLVNDEPQTLESIGSEFGVTRERVRQIEVKALDKLKRMMHQSNITAFDSV